MSSALTKEEKDEYDDILIAGEAMFINYQRTMEALIKADGWKKPMNWYGNHARTDKYNILLRMAISPRDFEDEKRQEAMWEAENADESK